MNFKKNEKYATIAFYAFLTIAASALVITAMINFGAVRKAVSDFFALMSPFTYGFIFAYLINPVMMFYEGRVFQFKNAKNNVATLKRALSLILALLTVALIIIVLLYAIIPQTIGSYEQLGSQLNEYITNIQDFGDKLVKRYSGTLLGEQHDTVASLLAEHDISFSLKDILSKFYVYFDSVLTYVLDYGGKIFSQIKNMALGLILAVYFLASKEKLCAQFKKLLLAFTTRRAYINTVRLGRYMHKTFGGFLVGKLIDSLIIGLMAFIVLVITKVPYYPLLSVIIGITNIVPFFGPIVGGIICTLMMLIVSPAHALWVLIFVIILQQLDGNVIGPAILGNTTGLSSLWVVIAITGAGAAFGFAGMILGVPATAVIYVLTKQWSEKRLRHKNMPYHTEFFKTDPPSSDTFDPGEVFIDKSVEIPALTPEDDIPDPPEKEKKKPRFVIKLDSFVKKITKKRNNRGTK